MDGYSYNNNTVTIPGTLSVTFVLPNNDERIANFQKITTSENYTYLKYQQANS